MDEPTAREALRRGMITADEYVEFTESVMDTYGQSPSASGRIKALASGAAEGAAALAGFPSDIADMVQLGASKIIPDVQPPSGKRTLPGSTELIAALERAKLTHRPVDNTEKVLRGTAAMTVGFLNPFKPLKPFSKPGVAGGMYAGAGGEIGEILSPDQPVVGSFAGQAPALIAAGLVAGRKPNVVSTVQQYLDDTGPGLQKAQEGRKKAEALLGIPTLLNQGTERSTALDGIVQALLASPQGRPLRSIVDKQQAAAPRLIRDFVDQLGGEKPSQLAANMIQEAGPQRIQNSKKFVEGLVAPKYAAAAGEMRDPTKGADAIEAARVAAGFPPTSKVGAGMIGFRNDVAALDNSIPAHQVPSPILGPSGKPLMINVPAVPAAVPATELNVLVREAAERARNAKRKAASGEEIQQARGQAAAADALAGVVKPPGSKLADADATFARLTQRHVTPLEQGAFGARMFPAKERSRTTGNFEQFVSRYDSLPPGDRLIVARELIKVNPKAVPSLVRARVSALADKALTEQKGRSPIAAYADFSRDVYGAPRSETRAKFNADLKAVAEARGANPALVVEGASKVMDAMRLVARGGFDLGQVGPGMPDTAGRSWIATFLKSIGVVAPVRGAGGAIQRGTHDATYRKLVNALVSEDGVKKLQEIAQYSLNTERGKAAFRGVLAEMVYQGVEGRTGRDEGTE